MLIDTKNVLTESIREHFGGEKRSKVSMQKFTIFVYGKPVSIQDPSMFKIILCPYMSLIVTNCQYFYATIRTWFYVTLCIPDPHGFYL